VGGVKRLLLILLLLASPDLTAQDRPKWPDYGGKPMGGLLPEGQREIAITFVIDEETDKLCRGEGVMPFPAHSYLEACATFNEPGRCTIIMPPNASDEIVRHEIAHCLKGRWHD